MPATSPIPVEPTAPQVGFLTVLGKPAANVRWQGHDIGTTPLRRLALPPGKQTLEVSNRRYGLSRRLTVDITAGTETRARVECKVGTVALQVKPWAKVYLGSELIGTTPVKPFELCEGTHELKLVNTEASREPKVTRVKVDAGKTAKLSVDLSEP